MGHRANFVVIEKNTAKAYYDQWAAMGCIYPLAGGPDEAVAALTEMEKTTELMDWAFAEGGYLLDFDQKTAIVFGMSFEEEGAFDDVDDDAGAVIRGINAAIDVGPRAYLEHIAGAWRGWKLIWSITTQAESHPSTIVPPESIQA